MLLRRKLLMLLLFFRSRCSVSCSCRSLSVSGTRVMSIPGFGKDKEPSLR